MGRVRRIVRVAAVLATFVAVVGAEWPMDEIETIIGGLPCC